MSKRTDVDALALLPDDERTERLRAAVERIEMRANRCRVENRDLTAREASLCTDDRDELEALLKAVEIAEHADRMRKAIGDAIETRSRSRDHQSPFMLSDDNVQRLETARSRFEALTVLETRAALATTDMGTAREYGPNGLQAPRSLWRSSGIPTTAPDGYAAVVPQFTLPGGVALVGEGVAHAEFDGVNPDAVTIGRAGAWSTLTGEALLSTSIAEVSAAHARIIARNVDKATVTKIEDATPDALSIDEALVTVAAECACDVSDLWIFGDPAGVAALVGTATFTPANGGDAGSFASRYGGAAVYPTALATADT